MSNSLTRERWVEYLRTTPAYGTYENRKPEYYNVAKYLTFLGLRNDDLIVDVGSGSCDLDHYLRTEHGWRGKFLPIDGATHGVDFNRTLPYEYLPSVKADFYTSIETLEHVYDPERLIKAMKVRAKRGIVVTTPNAAVVDVLAVDSTHVTPIFRADLEAWGFSVIEITLNDRGRGDTLVGIWTPEEAYPSVKVGQP